jgi:hypothetical protein
MLVGFVNFGTVHATDVSGIISSNATWAKAASPYSLTGNVLVYAGATLTIEAGVTVNFNGNYILVNDTLRALGSGGDKIQFNDGEITFTEYSSGWNESTGSGCIIDNANLGSTSVDASSASPKISSSSLSGIIVGGSTILLQNTLSEGLTLNYGAPTVSYNTISGDVSVAGGTPIVSHNTISSDVLTYGGSPVVSYNTILGDVSTSQGSPSVSGNTVSGDVSVEDVSAVVTNNTISGGVSFRSNGPVLVLSYNDISARVNVSKGSITILNNTISGGIDLSPVSSSSINATITNNTITGNEIGLNIAPSLTMFLYGSYTDAIITDNVIYGCTTAGIKVGGGTAQSGYTPRLNTAMIDGNMIAYCGDGINGGSSVQNNIIAYNTNGVVVSGIPVEGNTIFNNQYGIVGGSLIQGNAVFNNEYGINGGNEILNNTIINNIIGVTSSFTNLNYNNIYNNSELNVNYLAASNANATYNWWGTTDTEAINQTIYDFKNDFTLGTVNFTPFLTEPNPDVPPPETPPIVPDSPTLLLTSILMAATVAVGLMYRKKRQ